MVFKSFLSIACVCIVVSFNANAALVSADWKAANDNLITIDDNGLEWLDLTVTAGLSYDYVFSQLSVGGEFEGWTFANSGQIEGLFDSAGGTGPYTGQNSANNGVVTYLLGYWGDLNGGIFPTGFSYFWTGDISQSGSHWVGNVSEAGGLLPDAALNINDFPQLDSETYTSQGSALVKASVIPIPSAVWLFGSGLIGLIGVARRKKA